MTCSELYTTKEIGNWSEESVLYIVKYKGIGKRTYNDKAYTSPQLFGPPVIHTSVKKCPDEHKNLDYWYLLCKYGPDT